MLDQILQNSSDSIDIEIFKDGVLTDADGDVTVTIADVNGAVLYTNQLATKSSTGKYQFTLEADKTTALGTYSAVWSFTLALSAMQHTQLFQVVSAVTSGYLLTSEYRTKTSLDVSAKSDEQLTAYIDRATFLIEAYLGGSVRTKTYQETQRCVIDFPNNGVHIQLDHSPILSVDSVSLEYGPGHVIELTTSTVRVNKDAGYLEYFGIAPVNSISVGVRDITDTNIKPFATVVYTAGYNEIPERVVLATIRLVDQLINQETNQVQTVKSVKIGEYSESYESSAPFALGKIGKDEVAELLKDYKHPIMRNRFIV